MKDGAWSLRADLHDLKKDFREEELKQAVWKLGSNKPPRPNGVSLIFFKSFWKEIREDLI